MSFFRRLPGRVAALGMIFLPQLSQAGDSNFNGVVIVGPLEHISVPSLSNTGLIVLGLLLAVVAIRVFRNHQGAFNLLAVVTLTGGLVTGGIGIERAWASGSVIASGDVCEQAGPVDFDPFLSYNFLENRCRDSIKVIRISADCPLTNPGKSKYRACSEGDVLSGLDYPSEETSCALPYCDN